MMSSFSFSWQALWQSGVAGDGGGCGEEQSFYQPPDYNTSLPFGLKRVVHPDVVRWMLSNNS